MEPGKRSVQPVLNRENRPHLFSNYLKQNVMKKAKLLWLSAGIVILAAACQKNTSPSVFYGKPTDAASAAGKKGGLTDVEKILANYKLVWNDEFNGTQMDTSKWSYRANGTVRQYATVDGARTISLDGNGNMVIRVVKDSSKYYVGQASTDGHFNPKYGYYECRAKMNKGIGPHIAFWLQSPTMGNTPYNNPAVNGAEVDIFEYHRNSPGKVWQTIHINGYGSAHQSQGFQVPYPTVDTGYHTFGLLWTDSGYKFYVDGNQTWETTFGLSKRTEYMILSTELTGFGGTPSLGTYPDSVVFDYVRVYQPN